MVSNSCVSLLKFELLDAMELISSSFCFNSNLISLRACFGALSHMISSYLAIINKLAYTYFVWLIINSLYSKRLSFNYFYDLLNSSKVGRPDTYFSKCYISSLLSFFYTSGRRKLSCCYISDVLINNLSVSAVTLSSKTFSF